MYIRRKTDSCDSFDIVGSFGVVDYPMPLIIHLIHQMPTIGQMPLSFTKGYRNTSDSADGTCITKREKNLYIRFFADFTEVGGGLKIIPVFLGVFYNLF